MKFIKRGREKSLSQITVLVCVLCAGLFYISSEAVAQKKAGKPKSKVEQEMERWVTPPGQKAQTQPQAAPKQQAVKQKKKTPPPPKIVPATPKQTAKKTTRPVKKRQTAPAKPEAQAETPLSPEEAEAMQTLDALPPADSPGKQQHSKLIQVTFNGTQANIEVRVDGEAVGVIDEKLVMTTKLKPGPHTATFVRPGFEQQDLAIEVKANQKNNFTAPQLKPIIIMTKAAAEPPAQPQPAPTPVTAAPVPTVTPTPAPTTPAAPAGPSTVEVQRYLDNLIQKFKDPDKTAQVSAQEWAEARAQIAPALRRDSGNYELQARDYLAQGQIKFLEKDYFEALQRFREGVRLMPNSAVLRYALGTTFLVGNQPNEAIEQFRAAVAQESSFALAHKALGDAYTKLGDTKNANNEYLRARTLGFRSADISAALGRNLMREPTWQQAVTELNAAAESKPTVATYLDLATCYDALKRPFAQVDALLSAIKIDPNAAEPYYKLGEIYFANNEFLKAAEAFEKYLFKAPEDPKPRRDTARLRANEARRRAESGK